MTQTTKAYLALIFICIVWGTTYLAIRVGVQYYPPFLFAGSRQVVAGLLLLAVARAYGEKFDFSGNNLRAQSLIGFLMLTLGNGGVTWAEKYIPSGIAALLCSMMPIFAILFNLLSSKRDHFNWLIGGGMLMGFAGVALIFRQSISDMTRPEYVGGMIGILIATSAWAYGSMVSKNKARGTGGPLFNAALQLGLGGVFMLLISPVADDFSQGIHWHTDGAVSLLYLISFGSVLAYAAYMYALRHLPVGIATIYAYINPLIAVVAGYLFLNEALNIYIGLAFATIATSVYVVNRGYRLQKKQQLKDTEMAVTLPDRAAAES